MDFFTFDDEYVRRLREGDPLVEQHFKEYFDFHLRMKLHSRLRSRSDVEDVIQEVYLRVLAGLHSDGGGVHDSHKFGAYVHGVCNHVLQEFLRKQHDTTSIDNEKFQSDDNPFLIVADKEKKEIVGAMLEWLERENERDARIVRDLFLNELDKNKVCAKYGVTREYLRVLVHRALKKFREKYDDPDDS